MTERLSKLQTTLFNYQPPLVIPNFGGDFNKQMDFIKSLPEEDLWRGFNAFENAYD